MTAWTSRAWKGKRVVSREERAASAVRSLPSKRDFDSRRQPAGSPSALTCGLQMPCGDPEASGLKSAQWVEVGAAGGYCRLSHERRRHCRPGSGPFAESRNGLVRATTGRRLLSSAMRPPLGAAGGAMGLAYRYYSDFMGLSPLGVADGPGVSDRLRGLPRLPLAGEAESVISLNERLWQRALGEPHRVRAWSSWSGTVGRRRASGQRRRRQTPPCPFS